MTVKLKLGFNYGYYRIKESAKLGNAHPLVCRLLNDIKYGVRVYSNSSKDTLVGIGKNKNFSDKKPDSYWHRDLLQTFQAYMVYNYYKV